MVVSYFEVVKKKPRLADAAIEKSIRASALA